MSNKIFIAQQMNRFFQIMAQQMQLVTDAIRNGELLEDEVTTLIEKINRNKTE